MVALRRVLFFLFLIICLSSGYTYEPEPWEKGILEKSDSDIVIEFDKHKDNFEKKGVWNFLPDDCLFKRIKEKANIEMKRNYLIVFVSVFLSNLYLALYNFENKDVKIKEKNVLDENDGELVVTSIFGVFKYLFEKPRKVIAPGEELNASGNDTPSHKKMRLNTSNEANFTATTDRNIYIYVASGLYQQNSPEGRYVGVPTDCLKGESIGFAPFPLTDNPELFANSKYTLGIESQINWCWGLRCFIENRDKKIISACIEGKGRSVTK